MKVEIVYSEHCQHCHELMEKLKKQAGIPGMEIEYIDIGSDKGLDIAINNNISAVPAVISENGDKCEIVYTSGKVEVVCPEVTDNVSEQI